MLLALGVLVALIWLASRLFKFLSIPVENMVHALNIKTPPSTKVSIDKISNTSITIHWENEPVQEPELEFKKDSITQYILYVNNLQMGVFPNCPHSLYTCCSITNLKPATQYQLDFITVNNMGFISKLPSIFVMTKTEQKSDNKDIIKNRKWRRNTVSSPNANSIVSTNNDTTTTTTTTSNNNNTITTSQDDATPSYANLTNIKDLETYTIDDLKKILICAQEDLHDVLTQQTSYLQDFKESKEELNLELDNLKTHWSHELDFRKSLKSNIKSLENNKLLSDMKTEKLNQKIVKTNDKLIKMKSDITKWSEIEKNDLNRDILDEKYSKMNAKLNESIKELEDKISLVQNETGKLEKENKELSFMKKSSSSTNLSTLANNINNLNNNNGSNNSTKGNAPTDEAGRLASIIRKANSFISKDNGLLSPQGEEYLRTLNDDNQLVKLIKEQLTIDAQNHEYWSKKKQTLGKTIKNLEIKLDKMDKQNRQLRAKLLAQPYNFEITDNQNQQQMHFIPPEMSTFSGSNSKSFVNLTNLNSNSNQSNNSTSQLQSSQPLLQQQQQQQSSYVDPGIPQQGSLLQSQLSHQNMANDDVNQTLSSFPVNMSTTTTTAMANVNASAHSRLSPQPNYASWAMPTTSNSNVEPQEQPVHENKHRNNDEDDLDQPFDYDNANHLITGLQDMIYDEPDYPEEISNYSKGFTTDQLDNYWTSQRGNEANTATVDSIKIKTTEDGKPYPTFNPDYSMQTPMTSRTREFGTPLSKSPFIVPPGQPAQSLLAATLNDQTMSPFGNDSLSLRHNDSAGFYRQPPNPMGQQTTSNNLTSVFGNNNSANAFSQSLTPHNSNILSSTPQAIPFPNEAMNMSDGYHQNMIYGSSQQDHIQPTVIMEEEADLHERSKSPSVGLFQSPSFNFLWHSSSPTKHTNSNEHLTAQNDKKKTSSTEHTLPTHKRNKSDGSGMSTWTNRLSLKSKAASTSSQESSINVASERDDTSTEKEEATNQPSSSSTGSGRKMSRLLSRSTVNDIFKLRNHDSHS
ncbi:hypothetical protein MOUN0_O02520 [Monosporozyma unispora]|nr:hypothetical protein C6P44_000676 [Kazachstania unispora]